MRRTYLAYEELKRECVGKSPERCKELIEEYKKRIQIMIDQEYHVQIREDLPEPEGKK